MDRSICYQQRGISPFTKPCHEHHTWFLFACCYYCMCISREQSLWFRCISLINYPQEALVGTVNGEVCRDHLYLKQTCSLLHNFTLKWSSFNKNHLHKMLLLRVSLAILTYSSRKELQSEFGWSEVWKNACGASHPVSCCLLCNSHFLMALLGGGCSVS